MIKHDKLFVCGAFCKGMVHFRKIENFILDVEAAHVRGAVLRMPVGYPAMLSEGNDLIKGDLLTLKPSEVLLALLDEFHGFSPFQTDKNLNFKESIEATLESGEVVKAHRYVLNPQRIPKNAKVIEGGGW
ncbi:MAG: gamma-glutamylcyclotransferase, partial [Bdellovibrionales bacterium]|nr:gamma-glutamylcyclotransferase [Bdellovibrionales bacterium]